MEKNSTMMGIDEKKKAMMFCEIRALEGENLKTGKLDDRTMVNTIAKIIQKYVKEEEQ